MKQVCLGYASIFTAVKKKNKIVKELLVLNEPWVTFSFFGRFHLLVLVWKFATWRFLSRNWITVTMTLSNGCAIYPDQDCMRQDADILLPGPWMTMRLLLTMFWYRLHCNSKSVWFCCIVRKQFHQPACFLSWDNQHSNNLNPLLLFLDRAIFLSVKELISFCCCHFFPFVFVAALKNIVHLQISYGPSLLRRANA